MSAHADGPSRPLDGEHERFVVGRADEDGRAEFYVMESRRHPYGPVSGVRACLLEHLRRQRVKVRALEAILGSADPERVESLLLDHATFQVNEVTLRPPATRQRFESIMRLLEDRAV